MLLFKEADEKMTCNRFILGGMAIGYIWSVTEGPFFLGTYKRIIET